MQTANKQTDKQRNANKEIQRNASINPGVADALLTRSLLAGRAASLGLIYVGITDALSGHSHRTHEFNNSPLMLGLPGIYWDLHLTDGVLLIMYV